MSNESKKKLTQKQRDILLYLLLGSLVGYGFVLGRKYQKGLIDASMKGVRTLTPDPSGMFPLSMSIPEIKEALKLIEGAEFADALVVHVNGVQRLLVR